VVLCSKQHKALLFSFHFSKYSSPVDYIVLVDLIKLKFSMDLVFNNRAASTVFEVVFPSSVNGMAFKVMVEEWVGV
jgi:hypothetical protein